MKDKRDKLKEIRDNALDCERKYEFTRLQKAMLGFAVIIIQNVILADLFGDKFLVSEQRTFGDMAYDFADSIKILCDIEKEEH